MFDDHAMTLAVERPGQPPPKDPGLAQERLQRGGDDLVRLYLNDIGRHPLLTREDEVRLAQEIEHAHAARRALVEGGLAAAEAEELRHIVRHGDAATRTLIESNLRWVVSIAKKYHMTGVPFLDVIQEGNLGLMHAVDKFDWRRGFKFSTYATWWIRQAIVRGIANNERLIRLPLHAGDLVTRLHKARSRMELTLGRLPTQSELAAAVEMPEEKVSAVLQIPGDPLSLSDPLREGADAGLADVVADRSVESTFDLAAAELMPAEIEKLLAPLNPRERQIVRMRFGLGTGEPCTLEEVGQHFEVTRERIRQIEVRAMEKLRAWAVDTEARALLAV